MRKQLPKVIRPTATSAEAYSQQGAAPEPQIEAPTEVQRPSLQPANDLMLAATPKAQWLDEHRLREAFKIVGRHRILAAVGGLFPMPAVNVVGVTAVILRMVKALGDLYGVPFEREKARSIVIGLMGGAAPAGLGAATASTLAFVLPGAAPVGLAVSSVAAAALTRRIGVVFIERFENGAAD
jgi:uncharacterized protein (DUF697 family)